MITQLLCPIVYDQNDENDIANLPPPLGQTWNDPPARIERLKTKIRQQLENRQTHCAYCGLELGGTSKGEIDHIAPKGQNLHPEFTYIRENLVLACNFCNGYGKKHDQDTIRQKDAIYSNSKFIIVHPYFQNPDDHFAWTNNDMRVIIQGKTPEGEESISMFDLDSPKMTRFRAKELSSYIFENDLTLDAQTEALLKQALAYK